MKLKSTLFILLILVSSCSSNQHQIESYRKLLEENKIESALSYLKKEKLFNEKESELLKLLELGTLHLKLGKFYQSLTYFNQAKDISDKLFTISVSKKIAGTLLNEKFDNYYGEKYERSFIRYYQILAHYNLYQIGKYESHEIEEDGQKRIVEEVVLNDAQKSFHLQASKATLLEWNSILEDMKKMTVGAAVYKDELLAKIVGGIIHEKAKNSTDLQIAKALYKEAPDTIFKYYNQYLSFNKDSKEFQENYSKFNDQTGKKIAESFSKPTENSEAITSYVKRKIETIDNKNKDNIYILWHDGLIAAKERADFKLPIPYLGFGLLATDQKTFLNFTANVLYLGSATDPSISIEYPKMKYRPNLDGYEFIVKNEKENLKKEAMLIAPVSEMAYFTFEHDYKAQMAIKATRVVGKYTVAILSAYTTYKGLSQESRGGLQGLAIFAGFMAADRGIRASEGADLREWVSLPHQVRMNSFYLKPGKYRLYVKKIGEEKESFVKDFEVTSDDIDLKTFL